MLAIKDTKMCGNPVSFIEFDDGDILFFQIISGVDP